jgi:hypothetical protein
MLTSKYLKLSSWGTAEIPGTLKLPVSLALLLLVIRAHAYGSAISLSVSLIILFGSAIAAGFSTYLSPSKGRCSNERLEAGEVRWAKAVQSAVLPFGQGNRDQR